MLLGLFLAALVWVVARTPSGESVTLRPVPTDKPLVVHITGAVQRPGVYALPQGARIQDGISAAGGFLAEADKTNINPQALEDGEKLDIPYIEGGSPVIATPLPQVVATTTDLININTDGRQRPLGIAGLEDKIVQSVTAQIFSAIWEEEFLGFSYGFRPGRNPHQALDALAVGMTETSEKGVLFTHIDTQGCIPTS